MSYDVIHAAPLTKDFKPLTEHEEQTPGTFFGGTPVLHLYCPNTTLKINRQDLSSQPDFAALLPGDIDATGDGDAEVSHVDVWVTSRHLTLWSEAQSHGLSIVYPTIGLHAQDGNAVLLQLILSDPINTADEDLQTLQMRIYPSTATTNPNAPTSSQAQEQAPLNGHTANASPSQQLYEAISACQELNPDPRGDEDEEGGDFDETAPGATGWITSENMAQFMDENGNFRIPENATFADGGEGETGNELGAGAGTRRSAAEVDAEDGPAGEEEVKWQRTG